MLILLYGCTTWMLIKHMQRKLDSNYTRMLQAVLNKSRRQQPTKQQLYSHLPPITKTIQVRQTRHAGHYWRSKDKLISDVIQWTPSHGQAKIGWPARTYNSSVPLQDVVWKTSEQWMIEASGKRGSGKSMLAVRQWRNSTKKIVDLVSHPTQRDWYGCVCVCVCVCVCISNNLRLIIHFYLKLKQDTVLKKAYNYQKKFNASLSCFF